MTKKKTKADKRKAYLLRWCAKPSWTYKEGALLLSGTNPEESYKFSEQKNTLPDVFYYWLCKQRSAGYLSSTEDEKPYRTSPGDIIRALEEHDFSIDQDARKVWGFYRYSKERSQRKCEYISWLAYYRAQEIIKQKYQTISQIETAKALLEIKTYLKLPHGHDVWPFTLDTLKAEFQNPANKSGRKNADVKHSVDIKAIAELIMKENQG
jgi:hypothetical protein